MNNFKDELKLNIESEAAIIQIISNETLRIRTYCIETAQELHRDLYRWNYTEGLQKMDKDNAHNDGEKTEENDEDIKNPIDVFNWISEKKPSSLIILLEDFHYYFSEHTVVSQLRSHAIAVARRQKKEFALIISQPIEMLPPEIEKEVQVMQLPLPDKDDLIQLMQQAKERFKIDDKDYNENNELVESALGLSTSEAQLAFSKAACKFKRLTRKEIHYIVKEKEQVIRKSGHLEYFHPKATLDDIGGLDNLKSWLKRRHTAFTKDAQDFGLETPRGILLLGLPGTGKSLAAKAVANAWQLPLLRLDMGKIFGGIVGQSEANIRSALQTAEALAPSILWIDEIEKGLSGMQSSGSTDGGTTSRVLGTFLTWMQEKEKPVFVVATANHINLLPPELLRKGRVDEIFFVDLPEITERQEIFSLHLKRRNRSGDFTDVELKELAKASEGFTGAEIEEAVKEAMFLAFDNGHQLNKNYILQAIKVTSPLSVTMTEIIKDTREWAKGRAVSASSKKAIQLKDPTKKPRLKQEGENPFIKSDKN